MKRKGAQGAVGTEVLLLAVVCVLVFVVMFGHMTAIKNIGIAVAALALVCMRIATCYARRKQEKAEENQKHAQTRAVRADLPGAGLLVPMAFWALWSLVSIGWSVFSEASVAAWLDEVAYPFIGFFAFYRLASIGSVPLPSPTARQIGNPEQGQNRARDARYAGYVEGVAWVATLILAVLCAMRFFGEVSTTSPGSGALDAQHFVGAPAEVGTLALIVIPFFVAMCARASAASGVLLLISRLLALSGILLALGVGLMQGSTTFPLCAALTLVIALAPAYRHKIWTGAVTALCLLSIVGVVTVMVSGGVHGPMGTAARAVDAPLAVASSASRQTTSHTGTLAASQVTPEAAPTSSDTLSHSVRDRLATWEHSVTSDARPAIWRFFVTQGKAHPWIGVGFGKPLGAYAYGADEWSATHDRAASAPPPQAHNMLLNTWLQLGWVGVVLQVWLWIALMVAYCRSGPQNGWWKASGLALVVGVFSHNLIDDVLLQSIVLAFWAHAGWTLGRARLSGLVNGRNLSGRAVAMRRLRRVGN